MLRDMAAQQKFQVDRVAPEHLETAFQFAHAYLMGATVALVNAGMLAPMAAMNLLRDLMQPIEQPLVDTGTVERVLRHSGMGSGIQQDWG